MKELLQQLAPGQCAAVVLRFYEDLPYDQISAAMGVTVGTAKTQVSLVRSGVAGYPSATFCIPSEYSDR